MKVKSSLLVPAIAFALLGSAASATAIKSDKENTDKAKQEQIVYKKSDKKDELLNKALQYASPAVKQKYENNVKTMRSLREKLGKKVEFGKRVKFNKKIEASPEAKAIIEKVKDGNLSKKEAKQQLMKLHGGRVRIAISGAGKEQVKAIMDKVKTGTITKEQAMKEMEKLPGAKMIQINKEDLAKVKEKRTNWEQQLQEAINKKDQKTIDSIITQLNDKMEQGIEKMQQLLNEAK
ncbi:hypothetical protein [Neobacillus drentensis]|uniref:hypothetical protein n=1 Tax=Neobacillus drentensis TaxID=220684 RepID=UPI0030033627